MSQQLVLPSVLSEEILRGSGIQIGSPYRTQYMSQFVERITEQGYTIFNLATVLQRIDIAGRFLSRFDPENVMVYAAVKDTLGGTRPQFKKPLSRMAELTGINAVYGRFMPGSFTNPLFREHRDYEVVVLSDPMVDGRDKDGIIKKALLEAKDSNIPVVAICNSDSVVDFVDLVIPANNKGNRAIATVYYLLTRAILLYRGQIKPEDSLKYSLEEFESSEKPQPLEEED